MECICKGQMEGSCSKLAEGKKRVIVGKQSRYIHKKARQVEGLDETYFD